MAPADILDALHSDGILVELDGAGIALDGADDAVGRWLPVIRDHKAMLIDFLKVGAGDTAIPAAHWGAQATATDSPEATPHQDVETTPRGADDRRTCFQCANLITRRCQAAKRGEIVASRNYEPIRDLPRRCEGYAPGANDPDRRHGRERWPGLVEERAR